MITQSELDSAIKDFENAPANYENCKKLATFYTIFDHLYTDTRQPGAPEQKIGLHGSSDFLQLVANKNAEQVWGIIDELAETLKIINPRLYEGVLRKIAE